MTDPPRWLDDADAPHGAASLLRSARASKPLDPAVQARSAARVAELVAHGATATTSTLSASIWTKVTVGLATVALVGGAAVGLRSSPARPVSQRAAVVRAVAPTPAVAAHVPRVEAPPPTIAPRPTVIAAPRVVRAPRAVESPPRIEPVEPVEPAAPIANVTGATPAIEPTETHPVGGGAVGGAPPASAATLLEETQSLAGVSTVIESDPSEARRRLSAYRERFPRSRLAPERDYLAFEVARRMGDESEARSLGEAFLRAHPRSPHASAVRARIAP